MALLDIQDETPFIEVPPDGDDLYSFEPSDDDRLAAILASRNGERIER